MLPGHVQAHTYDDISDPDLVLRIHRVILCVFRVDLAFSAKQGDRDFSIFDI